MKNLILTLFVCYGLSSCVVNSPSCHTITVSDSQNNIEIVNRPRIKTKVSHVGITFQIGAAVGGALAGMSVQPTTFFDSKNQPATSQVLNGVIGAVIGYGVTSIIYKLQGQGKTNYSPNFDNWLASYNRKKGTNYVSLGNGYDIIVNSPSNESNFKAKNISQSVGFKNAFPNSFRIAEVEKQGIANLNNLRDTEIFVREFPNSQNKTIVENKSVSFINNLTDTKDFVSMYPNSIHKSSIEKQAYNLVNTRKDADFFLVIFPNGNYTAAVQQKIKQWEEEERARIREAKAAQLRAVAEMWNKLDKAATKLWQMLPKSSGTDNAANNNLADYTIESSTSRAVITTEFRNGIFGISADDGNGICEGNVSVTDKNGKIIKEDNSWGLGYITNLQDYQFPVTVKLSYQVDCPDFQDRASEDKINGFTTIIFNKPGNYKIEINR